MEPPYARWAVAALRCSFFEGAGGERRRRARCLQQLGGCCCMEEQRAWRRGRTRGPGRWSWCSAGGEEVELGVVTRRGQSRLEARPVAAAARVMMGAVSWKLLAAALHAGECDRVELLLLATCVHVCY